MIGQTIAQYTIVDSIGAGGMGEVFLAEDTKLKRKVALKFLPAQFAGDPDARARFQREAEALAALHHPHIVTVFDVSEHEGRPFIAMEYVEGQSLKQLVASEDVSADRAIALCIQICEGLSTAHEAGIVHRDIKSDNIVVTGKNQAKVMDFGLATWRGAASVTQESSTLGTMAYMSPEQAQGGDVDQRSDLFSLGVVLYELLTGHLPFQGEHQAAVIYSILNEPPDPLERYRSGLPPGMQAIVDKLLDKDPETRYQSAAGVAADLKRLQKASDPSHAAYTGPVPTPTPVTGASPKSRKGVLASATILVAVIVALLVFKPWQIIVRPTDEAVAIENRLAVLHFDNLVDPEDPQRLGEITASLLISDISAAQSIQVVSNQRIFDILKLLSHEGTERVDRDVATQVAQKAHARWMLTGRILRTEPNIEMTAELIDVSTGDVLASPRISGAPDEDLFVLVDHLSSGIRKQLAVSPAAAVENDPDAVSLATASTEAYRHYLQGWDNYYQFRYRASEKDFRRAIDLDSTFVQAYYGLSYVATSKEPHVRRRVIARAMEHLDGLSEYEQLLIRARSEYLNDSDEEAIAIWERLIAEHPDEKEAYVRLAGACNDWPRIDYDRSIELCSKLIEIDPLFKAAYNQMAYDYAYSGEAEKAIWAINKYIELVPEEANPYDSRADLYALNGQLDEAIESYGKALTIDPEFSGSRWKMAYCYLIKGDYDRADSLFLEEASHHDRGRRSNARRRRIDLPLYRGQLREALRRANLLAEADLLEYGSQPANRISGQSARNNVFGDLAEAYGERHWYDSALAVMEFYDRAAREDSTMFWPRPTDVLLSRAYLASDMGYHARADSLYGLVVNQLDTTAIGGLRKLTNLRASMAFDRGEYATAAPLLELGARLRQRPSPWGSNRLGRAYLELGSIGKAVETLEQAGRSFDFSYIYAGTDYAERHYWLGQAYEASGWTDKAIEQYEAFLRIWKDADSEILTLEDARKRLAKLKEA